MKGIFFSQLQQENQGPYKKVLAQVKAFEDAGFSMKLVENPFVTQRGLRGNFILRQIISRLPFTYIYSKHIWMDDYKEADFYYIRCMIGDRYFTKFLKKLKENNPKGKIILEFADFPATFFMTNNVISSIIYFPDILKDYISHKQYHKYIDRIALLQDRSQVYGVPVIKFMNGIDTGQISIKKTAGTDIIKMIAVAGMKPFHGYDRLIEGLYEYYSNGGTRNIEFHLVGGKDNYESEVPRYKKMVEKYHLKDKVFFYGSLTGNALDEIYDQCNLAVSSLAMFRIRSFGVTSSLKVREYLAKGMPVIIAGKVDVISDDFKCALEFANDNTFIEVDKIVCFFDSIYEQCKEEDVINGIRKYAEKKCDTQHTMKPIIDYIKSDITL